MPRSRAGTESALPGFAGVVVYGTTWVAAVSKLVVVIGTLATRTSYPATRPPPVAAGAVQVSWNEVCRRSSTVATRAVGRGASVPPSILTSLATSPPASATSAETSRGTSLASPGDGTSRGTSPTSEPPSVGG